jgi:hypothetical protein
VEIGDTLATDWFSKRLKPLAVRTCDAEKAINLRD